LTWGRCSWAATTRSLPAAALETSAPRCRIRAWWSLCYGTFS